MRQARKKTLPGRVAAGFATLRAAIFALPLRLVFAAAALGVAGLVASAQAGQARTVGHLGAVYDVYAVEEPSRLRLFWRDPRGLEFRSFARVKDFVAAGGQTLLFAMNAGMFHTNYAPVGLYVEKGRELSPLNASQGQGNFFMQPNGVFFLYDAGAGIMETGRFARANIRPRLATQSGPLLLEAGRMHPRFFRDSPYVNVRNGVGVRENGEVVFAVSQGPVNLYDFASLFRDALGCRDALYLDGSLSDAYIPTLGREGLGGNFGPIIGEVE